MKKILAIAAITVILFFSLATPLWAQSGLGDLASPLDSIKAKLEEEGVHVVDYSSSLGTWGSVPENWQSILKGRGYESLKDFAETFKSDFDEIKALKKELTSLETEKTRAPTSEALDALNKNIDEKKGDIETKIQKVKDGISKDIGDYEVGGVKLYPIGSPLNKEGADLLYTEAGAYLTVSKWGRLPERVVAILEGGNSGYLSLTDLSQAWAKALATAQGEVTKSGKGDAVEMAKNAFGKELMALEYTVTDEDGNEATQRLTKDDVDTIVQEIQASQYEGESQLYSVAGAVAKTMRNLIGGLAIIWIIVSGVRLVIAQGDETVITEQKQSITYAIIGLIAVLLVERMVAVLYGTPGEIGTLAGYRTSLGAGNQAFSNEVLGIVSFIKAIIGIVAILMIIVSGVNTIFAQGEEEQITKQRKSVIYIALGLVIILVNEVVVKNIFIIPTQEQSDQIRTSNVVKIINLFGNVAQFLLGFVGVIALGMLIYGGASMIVNYGNEEMVERGKKIIKNAIIGIIIIISAYAIVATMIGFK